MTKLRCLTVDDEPIARNGIINFILRTPFLENTASAHNVAEAISKLQSHKIDLILLDIEMPGANGLSLLKSKNPLPDTIIITAHPQFAVEGFELNVIDYLLKPVGYDRFMKAVNKVRNKRAMSDKPDDQYLFVKTGTSYEKILITNIDYIEAKGNYLNIHTATKSILTYLSMKKVEEMLPRDVFLKIHKSYIINITKVTRIESAQLWLYKKSIPISRTLKEKVRSILLKNNKS